MFIYRFGAGAKHLFTDLLYRHQWEVLIYWPVVSPPVGGAYLPTGVSPRCEGFYWPSVGATPWTQSCLLTNSTPTTPLDMKTRHPWKYRRCSSRSSYMMSAHSALQCDLHDRDIPLYQPTNGKASQMHHGGIDAMASIKSTWDTLRAVGKTIRHCVCEIAVNEWFWNSAISFGLLLYLQYLR